MAPRFQSYRITRIDYVIMPRFNLSQLAGDLPLSLQVRLTSDDVPAPTTTAYSYFANVRISTVNGNIRGSGTGYAKQADAPNAAFVPSPKFSTNANSLAVPHYMASVLIASSVASNFYIHQAITV